MAKQTATKAEMMPIINGSANEVCDAALALVDQTEPIEGRELHVEFWQSRFDVGFQSDFYTARGDSSAPNRRAALMRLAGRCLALLALDEAVRGSDAVESEVDASEVFG